MAVADLRNQKALTHHDLKDFESPSYSFMVVRPPDALILRSE
jgi:hypothetical protein